MLFLILLTGFSYLTWASRPSLPSPQDSDKWLARRQSASGYPANTIDMPVCQIGCNHVSKLNRYAVDRSFS